MQAPLVNLCDSVAAESGSQDRCGQGYETEPRTSGSHVSHISLLLKNGVHLLAWPHRRFRTPVVAKLIVRIGFPGLGRTDIDGASRSGATQRRDSEYDFDFSPQF